MFLLSATHKKKVEIIKSSVILLVIFQKSTVGHGGFCFQMKSFHLRDMEKGKKQVMVTFVVTTIRKKTLLWKLLWKQKKEKT